jgi:outer membrane protein assembly factor BamB
MRIKYILASLFITYSAPVLAQLDWISDDGNASHTNSLAIRTTPANYHVAWETTYASDPQMQYWMPDGLVIAEGRVFSAVNIILKYPPLHERMVITSWDVETGKTLWSFDHHGWVKASYQNRTLLLQASGWDDHAIEAYDIKSSQMIYHAPIPDNSSLLIPFGRQTYFTANNNKIGSFDAASGSLNWLNTLDPGKIFQSTMSINDDYIVVRDFDNIRVLGRNDGKEISKIWVPDTVYQQRYGFEPAVLDDKNAYALFQEDSERSHRATLYAFDLQTHKIKWRVPGQYQSESLVLVDNMIYSFNDQLNTLNAINTDRGKIEWTWTFAAESLYSTAPHMIATADTIFIPLHDRVYAVSLTTHRTVWKSEHQVSQLALGGGKLLMVWKNKEDQFNAYLTAIALN